jgi:peptide/nickel transport system permease protein
VKPIIRYIILRILGTIPIILALTVIIFALTRLIGDPASAYVTPQMGQDDIARIKQIYHFNDPIPVQYYYYMLGLLRGDWGFSRSQGIPVLEAIKSFIPATFELALTAFVLSLFGGIALGTLSAVKRDRPVDHISRLFALGGYALPGFFLGLLLLYAFYTQLHWIGPGRLSDAVVLTEFPPRGTFQQYTGLLLLDSILNLNGRVFFDALLHLILPAITLAAGNMALVTRVMRSSMLDTLNREYVRTARAKGLDESQVIRKHARRNALIPVMTVAGLYFGGLIGYAVMVELVFLWPGLGRWGARSALTLDHAAILGFALVVGGVYILSNLIVDIAYAYLDPRIRVGGS